MSGLPRERLQLGDAGADDFGYVEGLRIERQFATRRASVGKPDPQAALKEGLVVEAGEKLEKVSALREFKTAARLLGISLSSLYRKIDELNL